MSPLDNIRIAAPCGESWESMKGSDAVRFCGRCDHNVYYLSDLTRADAEELIQTHEGRLCVRIYRRADGTVMTKNCFKRERSIPAYLKYAGAVLTFVMPVMLAVVNVDFRHFVARFMPESVSEMLDPTPINYSKTPAPPQLPDDGLFLMGDPAPMIQEDPAQGE